MTFDESFHALLGHEGGYSNRDPEADPGGETMWGVTVKTARANGYTGPMKDMPVDVAKAIYKSAFWSPIRGDELPPQIRYAVFDAAVNSGPYQAALWLQRAIGASADGQVGPQTLTMSRIAPPDFVVRRMLGQRLRFMAELKNWPHNSRGWALRIADLLETV